MTFASQVPDAGTPIFDARGFINPVWHQFFFNLLNRTGGTSGEDGGTESGRITLLENRANDIEGYAYSDVPVRTSAAEFGSDLGAVASHGVQYDPLHHAIATISDNGFMSATDKARIDALAATGSPTFAALTLTNGQVVFPAAQVPSANPNTLDDYEEGTFVPVLTFVTPGNLAVAYTFQSGAYTKIGRQVFGNFLIVTSSFTHTTASGALLVTGFPFANGAVTASSFQVDWGGITKAGYTQISGSIANGATQATFVASGSGLARASLSTADTPTGGTIVLTGTFSYFV